MKRIYVPLIAVIAAGLLVGCSKKNRAATPSTLTVPRLVSPAMGAQIKATSQPIALVIQNAVSTGKDALAYEFEVANDQAFSDKVFTASNVGAGGDGQTSVNASTLEAGKGYYWRARAVEGGAPGPYASAMNFGVLVPITIDAPEVVAPAAGETVYGPRPTFTVRNAKVDGPAGQIFYTFEVADNPDFSPILISATVAQQTDQTSFTPSTDLTPDRTYYFRVVASDPQNKASSPFATGHFESRQGIDLSKIVWAQGPDVTNWPQTSTITEAYVADGQLCIFHTKLGEWPVTDFFDFGPILEGNQWVIVNFDGTWYAGAADWYRPGQACKEVDNDFGAGAFYFPPLSGWVPRSGEVFGVMSSTPARLWPAFKTLDQRSNIQLIIWP